MQKENISIKLNNISEAYSRFSTPNHVTMDSDLDDHIKNSIQSKKGKVQFSLNVELQENATEKEKEQFCKMVHNHFAYSESDVSRDIKWMFGISAVLFIIGALMIMCLTIMQNYNVSFIIYTIVEIFAWVFVWECVDILFFQFPLKYFRLKRLSYLKNIPIVFISHDNK